LDQMAKGDMPDERQLRTIAAASLDEQKEVWKAHKPSKADPQVSWWSIAQGLTKTRMFARDASFGDDLAAAYGIFWAEDLFAPADEDSRYTTDVEAYLGAQQEWMTNNLPKKGVIAEANTWGEPELPKKTERVYGKPKKSDHTALYLDRNGKVQEVHFRMPEAKRIKGKDEDPVVAPATRPDVTRKGVEMIGDFRTDALHDALARAPIEDDMLTALLILAFAGENVKVESANNGNGYAYGNQRIGGHAASLFDVEGKLSFDKDTLRFAARSMLVDVLSCQENRTRSGIVARAAGDVIGADIYLPNMGTDEFLSCLSRTALEATCDGISVTPQPRVKDTRAALVAAFAERDFVHPSAHFAPDRDALGTWLTSNTVVEEDGELNEGDAHPEDGADDRDPDVTTESFREAAE
ncbi:MAG: plasmid partitioning protein, partial [Rhizobiaceae bacterium]|nr:plasmid partitioning protein [Rhizobiaceae bacterium]